MMARRLSTRRNRATDNGQKFVFQKTPSLAINSTQAEGGAVQSKWLVFQIYSKRYGHTAQAEQTLQQATKADQKRMLGIVRKLLNYHMYKL